ncbi:RHS repeat-associated core domain-containing protein, partial [Streptomyces sp. NPDC087849]|uniref:RHS repeat-associated core domain-containing protein n=1 Tax=Streptomyces sp. NPDC087849 TaxID=3365808 RepID=UPI00381B41AD
WGTTTWSATSIAYTPLRFPGQYFDPETGLHYNFHRYYDPETARYVSADPLGLTPAPNHVTYVENPHTWSDPLGLKPCKPRVSSVDSDWATKGAHIHISQKKGPEHEVRVYVDDKGAIVGEPIRLKTGWASDKSVRQAVDAINEDPKLRADLLSKTKSAKEHMDEHNWGNAENRSSEMQALIDKLENWP